MDDWMKLELLPPGCCCCCWWWGWWWFILLLGFEFNVWLVGAELVTRFVVGSGSDGRRNLELEFGELGGTGDVTPAAEGKVIGITGSEILLPGIGEIKKAFPPPQLLLLHCSAWLLKLVTEFAKSCEELFVVGVCGIKRLSKLGGGGALPNCGRCCWLAAADARLWWWSMMAAAVWTPWASCSSFSGPLPLPVTQTTFCSSFGVVAIFRASLSLTCMHQHAKQPLFPSHGPWHEQISCVKSSGGILGVHRGFCKRTGRPWFQKSSCLLEKRLRSSSDSLQQLLLEHSSSQAQTLIITRIPTTKAKQDPTHRKLYSNNRFNAMHTWPNPSFSLDVAFSQLNAEEEEEEDNI